MRYLACISMQPAALPTATCIDRPIATSPKTINFRLSPPSDSDSLSMSALHRISDVLGRDWQYIPPHPPIPSILPSPTTAAPAVVPPLRTRCESVNYRIDHAPSPHLPPSDTHFNNLVVLVLSAIVPAEIALMIAAFATPPRRIRFDMHWNRSQEGEVWGQKVPILKEIRQQSFQDLELAIPRNSRRHGMDEKAIRKFRKEGKAEGARVWAVALCLDMEILDLNGKEAGIGVTVILEFESGTFRRKFQAARIVGRELKRWWFRRSDGDYEDFLDDLYAVWFGELKMIVHWNGTGTATTVHRAEIAVYAC